MLKKRQNRQMMNNQNHLPQDGTEPGTSLTTEQETEDKDEQFPELQLRILREKKWKENS